MKRHDLHKKPAGKKRAESRSMAHASRRCPQLRQRVQVRGAVAGSQTVLPTVTLQQSQPQARTASLQHPVPLAEALAGQAGQSPRHEALQKDNFSSSSSLGPIPLCSTVGTSVLGTAFPSTSCVIKSSLLPPSGLSGQFAHTRRLWPSPLPKFNVSTRKTEEVQAAFPTVLLLK